MIIFKKYTNKKTKRLILNLYKNSILHKIKLVVEVSYISLQYLHSMLMCQWVTSDISSQRGGANT